MSGENESTNTDASQNANPNGSPSGSHNTSARQLLDERTTGDGFIKHDTQGIMDDGKVVTHTTFITTDPESDPQIQQDLTGTALTYHDNESDTETKLVLDRIKDYAGKIKCSDFQGKGTIDDYNRLFEAASKIANDSKHIELDIDMEGFNEFARAADDLSALFNSFIVRLQNVSIINDLSFLRSVSSALEKIWNLSEVFGKFKETIIATTSVSLPKSARDTKLILEDVMDELNCSMKFISYFADPSGDTPRGAELSEAEKGIIDNAVSAIDHWNVLCEEGLTIALNNNEDIQSIKEIGTDLRTKSQTLKTAAGVLRAKLETYKSLM